ncbi:hypothetical protein Pcinc_036593 [Petrolisthes cinctipes]|uniref:Alanine racemase N-terminal domain-containing protein n=1 Tax=Petrolisthes cinctipes TaxID=88211 RepID=A0AAE1BUH4_PETCI|nr:hypothetical protein Pcinc_036593 [Petrolisthes cinctipes]
MASVGKRVSELTTPAFVLDRVKVEANCSNMLATCADLGLTLRAQTKTHKTVEGTVLQTGGSKRGLVTSTLQEAEFYADHGFDDILYGYPFIPHHLPRVHTLTGRLEKFHVIVDSRLAVDTLTAAPPPPGKTWSVFIKVDCGKQTSWRVVGGRVRDGVGHIITRGTKHYPRWCLCPLWQFLLGPITS